MSSRSRVIKRKNIPLNVVRNAKRSKISHIKATVEQPVVVELHHDLNQDLVDSNFETEDVVFDDPNVQLQPTLHERRKLKAAESWEIFQNSVLDVVLTSMGQPRFTCMKCKETRGIVKCHQCGPQIYYCENCAVIVHQNSLFHHFMEIWQVCIYHQHIFVYYGKVCITLTG